MTAALTRLKPVWNDGSISLSSKIRLMRSLVTAIFLYAFESWTLTAELLRRIQALEMRCYRKILRITYKDHVTNEGIPAKIQQAIGPHEDLLTIVKKHKLQWYVRQVWPKPSCKAQWKGEGDKSNKGRGGKTTSRSGQAWSSPSPRAQWRTGENGGSLLWNYLCCPSGRTGSLKIDTKVVVRIFTISDQLVKQLTKMSSRTHTSNKHIEQN